MLFPTKTVEIRWNWRCKIFSLNIRRCNFFWQIPCLFGGRSKGEEDSYEVAGKVGWWDFQNSHFLLKNCTQEGEINQYRYKTIWTCQMPSFYAFNPNHSALQPITYNTNTSWFAPIVQLFVSFLSAASNNIRSIDYKVSTRPHSKTATQSIMSAKSERRFLLVPFGKIVKLLFIAGTVSFSFHQSLYQYGNILNTEWTAGTRHFLFKNALTWNFHKRHKWHLRKIFFGLG